MKKKLIPTFLVFPILFFSSINSQAQFGISGGVQISHMKGFQGLSSDGNLASFQLKVLSISPLSDDVVIIPSLGYSGKGYRWNDVPITDEAGNVLADGDIVGLFNYIQLSAPICYSIPTKQHTQFYVGAGPYVAYAVSGKGKAKNAAVAPSDDSWDLFEVNNYKRWDAGAVIEFASTLNKKYFAAVNVDFGLSNINNGAGPKYKNTAAGISIGYLF